MANISEMIKNGGGVVVMVTLADLTEYSELLINKKVQEDQAKEEKLYTPTEFAQKYDVDRTTVYRWEKKGVLKPYIVGDKKYYRECDLKIGLSD